MAKVKGYITLARPTNRLLKVAKKHQEEKFFRTGRADALNWLNNPNAKSMQFMQKKGIDAAKRQDFMCVAITESGHVEHVIFYDAVEAYVLGFSYEVEYFIDSAARRVGGYCD